MSAEGAIGPHPEERVDERPEVLPGGLGVVGPGPVRVVARQVGGGLRYGGVLLARAVGVQELAVN